MGGRFSRRQGLTGYGNDLVSCHSERSEESLHVFVCLHLNRKEILRFAQNDKVAGFCIPRAFTLEQYDFPLCISSWAVTFE
jgi:hypothetical protein